MTKGKDEYKFWAIVDKYGDIIGAGSLPYVYGTKKYAIEATDKEDGESVVKLLCKVVK